MYICDKLYRLDMNKRFGCIYSTIYGVAKSYGNA